MKTLRLYLFLTAVMAFCHACTSDRPRHIIGVSQCSEDIWRNWQNAELRMEANFHEGVELRFAAAYDDSERQSQQIDSLVASGIHLLIVAPNQLSSVSPAINRAYDRGIPVIVFERKTNSQKYTAFVSADNHEMGRQMGEYVASRLDGKGRVLEILGLKGSSPADERHRGFAEALKQHAGIETAATLQGDWTEEHAYRTVRKWLADNGGTLLKGGVDFVFGHNDRTAIGARRAFLEAGIQPLPLFCGIDGLPGKNGGIRQVRDSLLDASYIYPTRGDQLLQLALAILDGKPYEKETRLTSALVTHDNANVLLLESDEVARQSEYLERLHEKASNYMQQLDTQRTITVLAVLAVLLLLLLAAGAYLYFLQRARISEERSRMEREQLDFYTQVSHELRTPLTLIEGPLVQLAETKEMQQAAPEAAGLLAIVRRNTQQLTQLISKMLQVQSTGRITDLTAGQQEPAALRETPPAADAPKEAMPSGQEAATVLIVDDNADIRAYLHSILRKKYQVSEAADGQQGLARANELVPDLIVSDVMMPVMNGLEFCQRVKSSTATSHIPVILLTARALSQHQIEGYESGADAYITKPFAPEVLLARIGNLLRSRHLLKDLFRNSPQEPAGTPLPDSGKEELPATSREDTFLVRFRDFIRQNMADSDLSVETVGAELGLSRVQLYRKVKALTGQSPVELLRTARLLQGRHLLETTDKTVSEVAYEVGFSAPSYFAKCFKDEFGISPSDL